MHMNRKTYNSYCAYYCYCRSGVCVYKRANGHKCANGCNKYTASGNAKVICAEQKPASDQGAGGVYDSNAPKGTASNVQSAGNIKEHKKPSA